jgi:ergothioneine biosynthesis protein EgtB
MSAHRSVLSPAAAEADHLRQEYLDVRGWTERLSAPLTPEDQMVQSCVEASPTKWHRAHTTWFFETFILTPLMPGYRAFDPAFRTIFNSYYNAVGDRPERTTRGAMSRPSAEQVRAYREYVDGCMLQLLERGVDARLRALVAIGLNHEQQHQELIVTDIKHAFATSPLRTPYWNDARRQGGERSASLGWIDFDGGVVTIGHSGKGFAFDNEGPQHEALLRPFRLASRLITNAEYIEFITDGGYQKPALWLSDGWDAVRLNGWRAPLYWEQRDGGWHHYTCAGMREVDGNQPVCHVSFYEADAFARWRGARLATEFEWEIAARSQPVKGNLLDDELLHPAVAAGSGLQQMFGDCWEWTASPYVAYPGYRAAEGALGEYNGKFMCNQMVLRGGSCATPRSHIRATYRNFFPPQTRWQFSGIRLANDRA